MNRDFQQYATSQAFVLTMSRPMISLLAMVANDKRAPIYEHLNACYGLRRRGLLAFSGDDVFLSEEGKLVLELCGRAGLVATKLRKVA